jgi:hypothetical protein
MLDKLREAVGAGGPAAALASELIELRQQYVEEKLTLEEYQFLTDEIASVRASQELSTDEAAMRFIITAANTLSMII